MRALARLEAAWSALDAEWMGTSGSTLRLAGLLCVAGLSMAVVQSIAPSLSAWGWAVLVTLGLGLPAPLYAVLVLGETPRSLGLGLGRMADEPWPYGAGLVVLVAGAAQGSASAANQAVYPMIGLEGLDLGRMVAWTFAYGAQFVALEIFVRGALLVPLARRMGSLAVATTVLPYVMLHGLWDKPLPEAVASIVFALFTGTLALRHRSLWGCVALHLAVAWTMDWGVVLRVGAL